MVLVIGSLSCARDIITRAARFRTTMPWRTEPLPTPLPDAYVVVRGGTKPLPPQGTPFSAAAGVSKADAAQGVPHGQIRMTSVAEIRARGGSVEPKPEKTRSGRINYKHVEVIQGELDAFGELEPNPIPREERVQ